jgi:hypothetical protein
VGWQTPLDMNPTVITKATDKAAAMELLENIILTLLLFNSIFHVLQAGKACREHRHEWSE